MKLFIAAMLLTVTTIAHAKDTPRWRIQGALTQGFGGSRDRGTTVASFPTRLDLSVRMWKPLSITVGAIGVVSSDTDTACGDANGGVRRPNAALGTIGLRTDFSNSKTAGWLAPFVEVHAGVGGQAVIRPPSGVGPCGATTVFASGGARVGLDVWLGKVAVTLAAAFDYLPVASPLSISLGAAFALF